MPFSLKTLQLLQSTGADHALIAEIIASIQVDFGVEERDAFVPREPQMSRRRRGAHVSDEKRLFVLKRDGYRCAYCPCDDPTQMTVDHIHPRSRGGTNDLNNLACACGPCNNAKADMTLEEWRLVLPDKDEPLRPLPERKPYTLRSLRKANPPRLPKREMFVFDAATVAEGERMLQRLKQSRLSTQRKSDRDIVLEAQRALAKMDEMRQ